MNKKNIVASILLASLLLTGCGTTNRAVQLGNDSRGPKIQIGYFSKFDSKVFAKLQREGSAWKVVELSSKLLTATNETEEVVVLDRSETRLKPGYTGDYAQFNKSGELIWFDCSEVLSAALKNGYLYSGCSKSAFNKVDVTGTVGKNVFAIPLTLGLAAGTKRKVDTEAMEEALKASNAYELMKNYSNIMDVWENGQRTLSGELEVLKRKIQASIKVDGGELVPTGVRATPELKIVNLRDKAEAVIPSLPTDGSTITMTKLDTYRQTVLNKLESQHNGHHLTVSCTPKAGGFDFNCSPGEVSLGLTDTPPNITAKVTGNKDYRTEIERRQQQQAAWKKAEDQRKIQEANKPRDSAGREIVKGPVRGGYWNNVRIVSSSVGVDSSYQSTTIRDSIIDADICLVVGMAGAQIFNTEFNCRVCVIQEGPPLGNQLIGNRLNCS